MQGYRSAILHFLQDPFQHASVVEPLIKNGLATDIIINEVFQYYPDGILVVGADGKVVELGEATSIQTQYPDLAITEYKNTLMTPGFVDTHSHMPQTQMTAAYGTQLLDWLSRYTFPTEARFAESDHCTKVVKQYLTELLRNGTTTANVFCTVHKHSVEIFFDHSLKLGLRMVAGKVLMDREGETPADLRDTAESGYNDSRALIEAYHGKGRCVYTITPRFAITSTPEQLKLAGELFQEFKDRGVQMHTHLDENKIEIQVTHALHPGHDTYLDVYARQGLIGRGAIFAHCVHLLPEETKQLKETNSAIAFCPTSNLFLGSGRFPLNQVQEQGIRVGIGTDTAGGTSFSTAFQTMNEAYKTQQMAHPDGTPGDSLNSFRSFYLTTLGGATALCQEDKIGNFTPGKEADFAVIDLAATPYYQFRREHTDGTLHDLLFSLNILGDDRFIQATYSMGKKVWDKSDTELINRLFAQ